MANYNESSDNRLFDKNIRELFGKIFLKNEEGIVNNLNEEDEEIMKRGLKNLERLEKEFYGEDRYKKKIILPNGSTRDEIIYKYNSKGQLIRTEENIAGEYLVFSEKNYQYDEKGNLIVLGADDKKFNEFFKYNENNQLIEHRTPIISEEYSSDPIPDIKVGERIEYSEYDSKGNLIGKRNTTTKLEDKWIEVSYSRYESDSKGNWVKRIYFQDATPKSVTIRTIEYY